jgi:hypothetical protein
MTNTAKTLSKTCVIFKLIMAKAANDPKLSHGSEDVNRDSGNESVKAVGSSAVSAASFCLRCFQNYMIGETRIEYVNNNLQIAVWLRREINAVIRCRHKLAVRLLHECNKLIIVSRPSLFGLLKCGDLILQGWLASAPIVIMWPEHTEHPATDHTDN